MTEALKLLIIFTCLNCGDQAESLEYIKFYRDSVIIADQTWNIVKASNLNTYGDKVHKGIFNIKQQELEASITIAGRIVYFVIPEKKINILLYQFQHTDEFYPTGEL